MQGRTVEDRLREEYFKLLPEIRRVAEFLEAVAKYHLLVISQRLKKFEQLIVRSRIKDCESALAALRRRQEGSIFDPDKAEVYTLKTLRDLAGVRVLSFPCGKLPEIDEALRKAFVNWTPDHVLAEGGEQLAFKYSGFCPASQAVSGEYQIVSMLTGLFWDVEHAAIYKPSPELRGVARSPE